MNDLAYRVKNNLSHRMIKDDSVYVDYGETENYARRVLSQGIRVMRGNNKHSRWKNEEVSLAMCRNA